MGMFKQYIVNRAKEASTWRGAILLLTGFGVQISPEMAETIVSIGVSAAGLVGMLLPDSK